MRQLLPIILVLSSWHVYATDQIISRTLDSPLVSNDSHTASNEEDRISACESKIQNLIGRVEVLEHEIKTFQKSAGAHKSIEGSTNAAGKESAGAGDHAIHSASAVGGNEKTDYDKALAALKESKFEEAESMFEGFMHQYPNSELSGNAYFWYAETFYRRGDFDKAAVNYLKGYKKYPKSPKAADALLKLALSLGELKKNKDACAILEKLEAEHKHRPSSSIKRAHDARVKYGCK